MDIVVIVLLVLLGVIVLAVRGKPLWNNWAKPLVSFLKRFSKEHPELDIWILIFLILGVTIWFGLMTSD